MYFNMCKFARSRDARSVRKFKLKAECEEEELSSHLNHMSTLLSPLFRATVPHAYDNMTAMEDLATECRIGQKDKKGNAFSGVTAVADFCAHSHRDSNNMDGGLTMVG